MNMSKFKTGLGNLKLGRRKPLRGPCAERVRYHLPRVSGRFTRLRTETIIPLSRGMMATVTTERQLMRSSVTEHPVTLGSAIPDSNRFAVLSSDQTENLRPDQGASSDVASTCDMSRESTEHDSVTPEPLLSSRRSRSRGLLAPPPPPGPDYTPPTVSSVIISLFRRRSGKKTSLKPLEAELGPLFPQGDMGPRARRGRLLVDGQPDGLLPTGEYVAPSTRPIWERITVPTVSDFQTAMRREAARYELDLEFYCYLLKKGFLTQRSVRRFAELKAKAESWLTANRDSRGELWKTDQFFRGLTMLQSPNVGDMWFVDALRSENYWTIDGRLTGTHRLHALAKTGKLPTRGFFGRFFARDRHLPID